MPLKHPSLQSKENWQKNTRNILLHQYGYGLEWQCLWLLSTKAFDKKSRRTDHGHFRSCRKHCRLYRKNLGASRALIFVDQGKQGWNLVQAVSFIYDMVVRRIVRQSGSMVNTILHQVFMNQRFWVWVRDKSTARDLFSINDLGNKKEGISICAVWLHSAPSHFLPTWRVYWTAVSRIQDEPCHRVPDTWW